MVVLKTRRELALMRDACRISAEALQIAGGGGQTRGDNRGN